MQAASLEYAGYQIAFIFTAFVAYTLVLWVLGIIVMLFYLGFKYVPDYTLYLLSAVL